MDREKIIVRTSYIGIAVNVLLSVFKAVVGLISGSLSVVLDAVNNLSDAFSSVEKMRFDLVLDYELENRHERFKEIETDLKKLMPDWDIEIVPDIDV